MRALVAIPTYWTRPQGEPPRPNDAIFDHPTPVDGASTLPRLLDSLLAAEKPFPFDVLVVVGTVAADLAGAAEARVRDMLAEYGAPLLAYDLRQISEAATWPLFLYIGPSHIAALQDRAARLGLPRETFSPHTYPGVRNTHLAVPYMLGYDVIIGLDDDEIVPPEYFCRAREALDATEAAGIAGLYLDASGSPYLPEGPATGNVFLDKARWINEGVRSLLSSGRRWISTPLAFGGNMVIRSRLIPRVGFDPYITRGEDIDYVLSAAMLGEEFVLDRELCIVHRPPREYNAHPYAKLAQDVRRFLYEREKMRTMSLGGDDRATMIIHSPYPGRFLADDIEEHAMAALHALADEDAIALWGSPEEIVEEALKQARVRSSQYKQFVERWPRALNLLSPDPQPSNP